MICHISIEMKVKLCIVVLEDYGNNLAQAKDNNKNETYGIASMLWDAIAPCEKHAYLEKGKRDMS